MELEDEMKRIGKIALVVLYLIACFFVWETVENSINNKTSPLRNHIKIFDIKLGSVLSQEECDFIDNHYDLFIGPAKCKRTKTFSYINVKSIPEVDSCEDYYLHYLKDVNKPFIFPDGLENRLNVTGSDIPSKENRVPSVWSEDKYTINPKSKRTIDLKVKEARLNISNFNSFGVFIDGLVYEKKTMDYFNLRNTIEYAGKLKDDTPEFLKDQYKLVDSIRWHIQFPEIESTMITMGEDPIPPLLINAVHPWYLDSEFINRDLLINNFDWFLIENAIQYPFMNEEDFQQLNDIMWITDTNRYFLLHGINKTGTNEGNLFLLAVYYLIQNENTFFGYRTDRINELEWLKAIEFDIGKAVDEFPISEGDGLYSRRYEKGIVLARFISDTENFVIRRLLLEEFRILQSDGTLGDKEYKDAFPVSEGDGFILIYN